MSNKIWDNDLLCISTPARVQYVGLAMVTCTWSQRCPLRTWPSRYLKMTSVATSPSRQRKTNSQRHWTMIHLYSKLLFEKIFSLHFVSWWVSLCLSGLWYHQYIYTGDTVADAAKLTCPWTFADKKLVGPVKLLCIIMLDQQNKAKIPLRSGKSQKVFALSAVVLH